MPPDPRDLICGAYPTFRSELDCVKSIDIFGNSSIHSKIFSLRSLDWSMRRKNSPFRVGFHPCRIFRDILASVIGRLGTEGESVQIVLFEQLFIEARRQVSRGLVVSRNVPQMFARKRHAKLVLVCCFALIALTVIPVFGQSIQFPLKLKDTSRRHTLNQRTFEFQVAGLYPLQIPLCPLWSKDGEELPSTT